MKTAFLYFVTLAVVWIIACAAFSTVSDVHIRCTFMFITGAVTALVMQKNRGTV